MINLDSIPVLCRTINRTDVGRRFMANRLRGLRDSLQDWFREQDRYCSFVDSLWDSLALRRQAEAFKMMLANELAFLHIALADMEVWSEGGGDHHLTKAISSYAKAQRIWRNRVKMMQKFVQKM